MSRAEIDFTTGAVAGKIIKFVLPSVGSFIIQQLYNSADLVFSGNFPGKTTTAAIGASSMISVLIIGLCGGLSVGTGVLFSKAYGAKDIRAQNRIGDVVFRLAIVFGLIMTGVGILLSKPILILMQTPQDILDLASVYLRIYFLGLTFSVLLNMVGGLLRATGNVTVPMIIQVVSGGLNILLDYIFIVVFPNGIVGVAIATIISQGFSAIVTFAYYRHTRKKYKARELETTECGTVDPKDVPEKNSELVKKIFAIGLPMGLQSMLVTLSNMFIQANINRLGVDSIAAFTAYFKVEMIMYFPIVSLGHASMYMVGQNLGAKKFSRIRSAIGTVIKMGVPLIAGIGVFAFFGGSILFRIFNPEPEVIAQGMKILQVTAPLYWVYVILEVLSNTLRAHEKTKTAMTVSLINFAAARAGLLALYSAIGILNIRMVASVYPITWISSAITFTIIWRRLYKKDARYQAQVKVSGDDEAKERSIHENTG